MQGQDHGQAQGVGARHEGIGLPVQGGGYQDIYPESDAPAGGSKNARDPRLDELEQMGLGRHWLAVAESIGVDAFLQTWRILDGHTGADARRLPVPRFSTYERYQRNRWIRALAASGMKAAQIRAAIARELCEYVSIRHIDRVIASGVGENP